LETFDQRTIHKLLKPNIQDKELDVMENWDVIIIGAGSAGLAAGILHGAQWIENFSY